jgi:hypothetical protein
MNVAVGIFCRKMIKIYFADFEIMTCWILFIYLVILDFIS